MIKKKPLPPAAKQTMSVKVAASKTPAAATARKPAVVEGPTPAELQLKSYEQAVRLFSLRKLAEARDRFLEAAKGPAAHILRQSPLLHPVRRERRTAGADSTRNFSAEDHFNHGVERLNARDVAQASRCTSAARSPSRPMPIIFFTPWRSAAALDGDGSGAACENLKRAIYLEPKNRILARQDPGVSRSRLTVPRAPNAPRIAILTCRARGKRMTEPPG